jgi:eukaryotic-like serine/threonine-protein kinase
MLGTTVTHYRILEQIGGGGMGVVYKAEDIRLGRFVAIKFLPEEFAADAQALERFRREARATSALNHSNICTLYDIGEENGRTFLVMELLEGQNLRQIISNKGALPLHRVLEMATDVAEGLEAAHEKGILHRDIKPANIFITERGKAKILDFGLAKMGGPQRASGPFGRVASESDSTLSGGWALGTIAYMSPEQALGKPLDQRTDLFSFGTVLYEMAAGVVPFRGETTGTLFLSVVQENPDPILQIKPGLPVPLQQIINKCLEKDREKRYQHATEVLQDLKKLQLLIKSEGDSAVISTGPIEEGKPQTNSEMVQTAVSVSPRKVKFLKLFTLGLLVIASAFGIFSFLKSRSGVPKLTEKDRVVLADFTNITGESIFDASLKQAARFDLEQSPFMNVLTDAQVINVLKQMDRPPNQRLTAKVTREVCLRSNSKAYIEGTIARSGSRYPISLKAVSCSDEHEIARSEFEAADRSNVLQSLGKVDVQLRRKLGESLASLAKFNRPLAEATTSSLEALQAYTQGGALYPLNRAERISYYRRAVELDPNFARAYASLGAAYFNEGQSLLAIENYKKAYDLRDRVSDRERYYIMTGYLRNVTGEIPKAVKACEEWVRSYPNDYTAHASLGQNCLAIGQYDKSASASRESFSLMPEQSASYVNAMSAYALLDRYDEAKAIYNTARARNIEGQVLRLARYTIAFLEHDDAGMKEQVVWAEEKKGSYDRLLSSQASAEAYYGHYGLSRELVTRAMEAALRDGVEERSMEHEVNAAVGEVEVGNSLLARRVATRAWPLTISRDVRVNIAYILSKIGDNAGAELLADQLDRERPLDTLMQKSALPTIRAIIELNKNTPEGAVVLLQPALEFEQAQGYLSGLLPAYIRGLAYLQAKKGSEAASEFQKVIDHPGIVGTSVTGALARLQLGRAKVLSGDSISARRYYQDFLALWKDADSDIPIFNKAKAEYARLH